MSRDTKKKFNIIVHSEPGTFCTCRGIYHFVADILSLKNFMFLDSCVSRF